MKLPNPLPFLVLALGLAVSGHAQTELEKNPAYLPIDRNLDLKTVKPTVNINLPSFLLMDVASGFDGGTNDPFAGTGLNLKDLVKDIRLIRLVIIENQPQHQKLVEKGMADLRAVLRDKWTCVVDLPSENIGIYAISGEDGQSMAGVALLIHGKGDAIVANIIGKVSIGKLVQAAGQLKSLPPELLGKLSALGGGAPSEPAKEPAADPAPAAK